MLKAIKKILSVSLAFWVVFTTSSFVVNTHYCCDTIIDISIFSKAETCKSKVIINKMSSEQCISGNEVCCSDNTYIHEADDKIKKSSFEINNETYTFLLTFFYSYVNLFEGLENDFVPFKDYSPPYLVKDILLINETFLI